MGSVIGDVLPLAVGVAISAMPIIADTAGRSTSGGESTASGVIKIVLGAVIVLLGVKQWRGRPHADSQPALPEWLTVVDPITPAKATGPGLALVAVNPKNLVLIVGTGVIIGPFHMVQSALSRPCLMHQHARSGHSPGPRHLRRPGRRYSTGVERPPQALGRSGRSRLRKE